MAWPASVITREITFGKAVILETGDDLSLRTVTRASRSLVSIDEGFRMESLVAQNETSDPGEQISFLLPVTNQPGWMDPVLRMAIEVGPEEHSHLYTTTLTVYNGSSQVRQYVIGPYPLPQGDGPLDADTMLISDETQGGALVPIPSHWLSDITDARDEVVEAKDLAVAAAERAEAVPAEVDAAVSAGIAAADIPGLADQQVQIQVNIQVGPAVDQAVVDADIPGQVSAAVSASVTDADIPALVTDAAGPIVAAEVAIQVPALIHPPGSANNPITDAAAVRPEFPKVFWQTSTEPVHWLDGDEWVEVAL